MSSPQRVLSEHTHAHCHGLRRAVGHLEAGRLDEAAAVLVEMMEDEDQAFYAGGLSMECDEGL